ncbi:MAG: hypothetical protein MJ213_02865 [Bacilli bacterium]|nr:hypothetical protein [Bacilli bacterium]
MSKSNQLIDAVKTATAIHNGDYSSLRGKSFVISDNIKKTRRVMNIEKKTDRITLADISRDLAKLNQKVDDGFKQVNARIDQIDARLDYIVKANNLKDSPRNK